MTEHWDSEDDNKIQKVFIFRDRLQILLLILSESKRITFISSGIIIKPDFLMISGKMYVNLFTQIPLIFEAEFGDGPLQLRLIFLIIFNRNSKKSSAKLIKTLQ